MSSILCHRFAPLHVRRESHASGTAARNSRRLGHGQNEIQLLLWGRGKRPTVDCHVVVIKYGRSRGNAIKEDRLLLVAVCVVCEGSCWNFRKFSKLLCKVERGNLPCKVVQQHGNLPCKNESPSLLLHDKFDLGNFRNVSNESVIISTRRCHSESSPFPHLRKRLSCKFQIF